MEPTYYIPFDNMLSHIDKIEELKKDLSDNANILYKELDEAGVEYEKIDYGVVIDITDLSNKIADGHDKREYEIMKKFGAVSAKRFEANESINYKDLLRKYIEHVSDAEGIDFIDMCCTTRHAQYGVIFTQEEIDSLIKLRPKCMKDKYTLEELESMSENQLCEIAENHPDDDVSAKAMLVLRNEYGPYFWCPDCDGLVTKGCESCPEE